MSRIPVPSHHSSHLNRAQSPIPLPERATSPLPPNPSKLNPSTSGIMSSISFGSGTISETRKKQSKRDEAIRRKIESELSRKRTISTTNFNRPKRNAKSNAAKGTVAALKPSPALTVPETITVSDASQLCAAKRTDCVLVVDEDEGLSGIFTAKDLAYRVTAEGLDPRVTPVGQIMTRNPMVTRDTTSATEALQLMVQRHFRHLPVCNEEGNVVGLLDITKVFHEALDKVERSSSASEKLFSALAGVHSELGPGMAANPQAAAMLAYVDSLREKTALPDLTTIMDSRTHPATVGPKATVRDAAKLMKEHRTTAVCVMDNASGVTRIAGIFTSKDVVLRVIAAGLEPSRCSVVRVMTPHPDVAAPTMTVQDALKKMHNGNYLNLPVVEEDGQLVAIVDVLKLTYATLEQMNQMSVDAGAESAGGPMWGRFFDSIGGHDDNESAVSGSGVPTDRHTPPPFPDSPLKPGPHSPEVHPNDSASVMNEHASEVDSFAPRQHGGRGLVPSLGGSLAAAVPPVDDGSYVFKFRTPSGRTHRFQARHDNFANLHEIVAGKLASDPFFVDWKSSVEGAQPPDPTNFTMLYTDADGDAVLITSDADVSDAVGNARAARQDRVVLNVQGGKDWDTAGAQQAEEKAKEQVAAIHEVSTAVDKVEPPPAADTPVPASDGTGFGSSSAPSSRPVYTQGSDEIFGIPKDLLLPASIGALAVVIIGIFTISRMSD